MPPCAVRYDMRRTDDWFGISNGSILGHRFAKPPSSHPEGAQDGSGHSNKLGGAEILVDARVFIHSNRSYSFRL